MKQEIMRKAVIKRFRMAVFFVAVCVAGMGCGERRETVGSENQTEQIETELSYTEQSGMEQAQTEAPDSNDTKTAGKLSESIIGSYFRQGDFRYRMDLLPEEEPDRQGYIQMTYSVRAKEEGYQERSNAFVQLHSFDIPYQGQEKSYTVQDLEANGTDANGTDAVYTVTVNPDGTVMLQGDTEAAGLYYSCEENLMMPDMYRRPLNDTDLMGLKKEELRLLRNEVYAVYGRIFTSQDLRTYFEGKGWYRGVTEPENFDDGILGGMMRRNVAFLKEAEETWDEETAADNRQAYSALEPAPYRELLPKQGEVLVDVSLDPADVTDKGIYYAAKGSISLPITLTTEQYRTLQAGNPIELTVDELTGEKEVLKKSENPQYGTYCLGEEPLGNYVEASYDRMAGCWYLWGDSADTRFKRVYDGDIYVLKGATEEYFQYFDLPAGQRREGPGNYRVMDFTAEDRWDLAPYSGNVLVADPNGYVKALYFYGD